MSDRIKNIFNNDDKERERLDKSSLFSYHKDNSKPDNTIVLQTNGNSWYKYVILVLLIGFIIMLIFNVRSCTTNRSLYYKQFDTLRLHSELEVLKDEYNKQIAINKTLVVENEEQLEQLVYKSKEFEKSKDFIIKYRKEIDRLQGIINVNTNTGINVTTNTEIDTIYLTDSSKTYVYKGKFIDEYVNIQSVSTKDSTKYDIKIKDNYTIMFGEDKKLFTTDNKIIMYNNNPYSNVKELTFIHNKPKSRPYIKYGIGLLVGFVGGLIIN